MGGVYLACLLVLQIIIVKFDTGHSVDLNVHVYRSNYNPLSKHRCTFCGPVGVSL